MAYENGYAAVDYIGNCIERYRKDSLAFIKAVQLIPVFMARPDWPHCFGEMDKAISCVIGDSFNSLIFGFTSRYLSDNRIEWPPNLPDGFMDELAAFHIAVYPIVEQFWMGRTKPIKFFGIAQSSDYKNNRIIRFIRMDGKTLEMEVDDYDIKRIINSLQSLLKNQEE